MTTTYPTPPAPFTEAQRQRRACICCGGDQGDLIPDGHRYVQTGPATAPLGWAVVAHPTCRSTPQEEP
ncbi:hypothetical protein [Streptomyces sp. BE303]|uniref:hypothetical protein n=1 Tax=Streptomyces sp. BE303 TaxID=3002528 RepID=UPI002E782F6D|nr:hypothetical protein [Streptomyces sp. BE303]MED7948624.1 hypothetical protein [Streptomyces sp. BE303]